MAFFESVTEAITESAGGLAVGIGAVIAAPFILSGLRPVAKQLVKGGIMLADQTKVWVAETGEQWADLVAEARSELEAGGAAVEAAE